jgi:hypothetical protein
MVGDVFEEAPSRLALSNDALEVGPEVVFTREPFSFARERIIGARIAAHETVNDSVQRRCDKGVHAIPDRRRRYGLLFHPTHEVGCGVHFPLDVHQGL